MPTNGPRTLGEFGLTLAWLRIVITPSAPGTMTMIPPTLDSAVTSSNPGSAESLTPATRLRRGFRRGAERERGGGVRDWYWREVDRVGRERVGDEGLRLAHAHTVGVGGEPGGDRTEQPVGSAIRHELLNSPT